MEYKEKDLTIPQGMARPDEITWVFERVVHDIKLILSWSSGNISAFRGMNDDMIYLQGNKQKIVNEIDELKKVASDIDNQSKGIIDNAKSEAQSIIAMAREQLAIAAKKESDAKKTLEEAETFAKLRQRQLEEMSKLSEGVAVNSPANGKKVTAKI